MVTSAFEPGAPVVTVPIAKVGAGPVAPVGPVAPTAPFSPSVPAGPVGPVATYQDFFKQ